ncbi:MAG: hypothetical protein ACKOC5_19485 [Chloroflexota bacterium]
MKLQTNLHAGMTFEECDSQRNWYRNMVKLNRCGAGPIPGPVPNPNPGPMPGPVPNPTPVDGPLVGACSENWYMGQCTKTCPYPPFTMPC